jgi:hypothetical protein
MPGDDEREIAAIFGRLKDEVRGGSEGDPAAITDGSTPRRGPLPGRAAAERAWAVTAERPFEHRPTAMGRVRGLVLVPVKAVLRKLMRWYVEPLAGHQRTFNRAVLTLVDDLTERTNDDVARLERRIEALEQRLASDRTE